VWGGEVITDRNSRYLLLKLGSYIIIVEDSLLALMGKIVFKTILKILNRNSFQIYFENTK